MPTSKQDASKQVHGKLKGKRCFRIRGWMTAPGWILSGNGEEFSVKGDGFFGIDRQRHEHSAVGLQHEYDFSTVRY
jgi:hypothetical protein